MHQVATKNWLRPYTITRCSVESRDLPTAKLCVVEARRFAISTANNGLIGVMHSARRASAPNPRLKSSVRHANSVE